LWLDWQVPAFLAGGQLSALIEAILVLTRASGCTGRAALTIDPPATQILCV
jgi:hypothetical protein